MNRNNDEIEIDLIALFRALWRRALIIIFVAVLLGSNIEELLFPSGG